MPAAGFVYLDWAGLSAYRPLMPAAGLQQISLSGLLRVVIVHNRPGYSCGGLVYLARVGGLCLRQADLKPFGLEVMLAAGW